MISKEDIEYYFYLIIDNKLLLASIIVFFIIFGVMAIPAYAVLTTPNPTPTPTIKPSIAPTIKPTITITPQVTPKPTIAATAEVTPRPTVRPTQDMTSMERFVVIITPTPTPVNKNVMIKVTVPHSGIEVNKFTDFSVYIKTYDQGYNDVTLRFNVSWNNAVNNADWVYLGYFPIQHYHLGLPANAQQTKPVSLYIPERVPGINMPIGPGVYSITLDVISEEDSSIIGSDTVNNIQVVKYNPDVGGYVFH